MDFAAWMEVWLGDRWWTFDPRNNQRRKGRVVIGRGRDASDVAMATTFGGPVLQSMAVVAESSGGGRMSPLDDVDRVSYRLDQTFLYRYDAPIQRLRHRLRVMPPPQHGPTLLETSRLTISGAEVRRRRSRDAAGNAVVRVVAERVDEYLEFAYSATLTRRRNGTSVLLDPRALGDPRWLRGTALTGPSEALTELAAAGPPSGHGPFDRLSGLALADALCHATHDALGYEYGLTGVRTTADEALAPRPRGLPGLGPRHAGALPDPWPRRSVRLGSPRRPGRDPRVGRGGRPVGGRPRGGGGRVRPVQRSADRCGTRHGRDRSRLPRRAAHLGQLRRHGDRQPHHHPRPRRPRRRLTPPDAA